VIARTIVALTVAVAWGLILSGCGEEAPSGTQTAGGGADLDGRTFESVEVRGHTLTAGSTVTLTFDAGRISASAGCNSMTSPADWDGDTLSVSGPMAMTRKACPPGPHADDAWLSDFLTSGPALRVEGGTLTLGDDTNGIMLRELEDLPLVGTRWIVDGLVSADAVSSPPADATADLTIDANGTQLRISTGCNTGSGGVTVEDSGEGTGTLVVGPVATTLVACPADVASVETQMLAVLQGRVDYVIDGRQLRLTNRSQGLTLTAAP
jgi:heat shock protein HslJ